MSTTSTTKEISALDRVIGHVDNVLRTCVGTAMPGARPNPAAESDSEPTDAAKREQAARLMRVNHAGEVAAQALYHGQALTARDPSVRDKMHESAKEEADHLAWCGQRLDELGASVSRLTPVWYAGSFSIGALAGVFGDRVSLGFIAETERQVIDHLDRHLSQLPEDDEKSRAILLQMREDEAHHAQAARDAGGVTLPVPVQSAMGLVAKVMTRTAYWW